MDGLFARVEEAAGFGENGVPARFAAEYDPADGHVVSMAADGRESRAVRSATSPAAALSAASSTTSSASSSAAAQEDAKLAAVIATPTWAAA